MLRHSCWRTRAGAARVFLKPRAILSRNKHLMASAQSSVCCSHRHVAGFLTSLSFLWLWLIQQYLAYKHTETQWNSGHPRLLFPELPLKVLDMPRFALPFGELSPALAPSHSLAMPVCLWSALRISVSGRHSPAQIQYRWCFSQQSFNQPLLQPFLSEQMWHFHRLDYCSHCLGPLWSKLSKPRVPHQATVQK